MILEQTEKLMQDQEGNILTVIDIKEKELPKELQWVRQIKMLQDKGYIVKYVYGKTMYDVPRGQMDSEMQSLIPVAPDKFVIYKHKLGHGFVKLTEIEGRSDIDPTPETAMSIWELFGV